MTVEALPGAITHPFREKSGHEYSAGRKSYPLMKFFRSNERLFRLVLFSDYR